MAVETQVMDSRLILTFYEGEDDEGNLIESTRSFNNVKTNAEDEALFDVAQALSTLQEHDLMGVERTDRAALVESE